MPHIPLYPYRAAPSPFHPAHTVARPPGFVRARRVTNSLTLLLAATALFVLSSCSSAHGAVSPATDFLGNPWPQPCRDQAALDAITISVVEVDRVPYQLFGESMFGLWIERPEGNTILIKRGLSPERRAEVLRHEACHQRMFELTGNPRWHGGEQ